ncbi:helicase domain protein [Mycobacterium kansasii]|uniref:Helicase domain protein n=1 Tax=Mycobacterium kansasii TaxID=1768 RepID=A0A1V3XXY0_MYCKA|nr:helicase domain protein [Mycobacterium kansasii]
MFANSRRLAERLTARLNEIHAERCGEELPAAPDQKTNPKVAGGAPAHIMASGQSFGAPLLLARAHHGSVSKEQRALVEEDLKRGLLRAVVATSSLELGIDMGAVDLVIQVEAPPSVANGLQRIGRAGHQVGEISRGVLFPKHRTDLLGCAVSVQRMLAGQIETMRVPANPLDILAQHTVAAAALEPLNADRWFDTVRRSAPFATLPRGAFEATLDLLSGKYPSTEFAELRPRLVYDRDTGTLTARPGAQRLAVTSGGAIPDRGLFTVWLATEKPSRVGELDEEMVYESRPGDVISLGATSWRITEITHDRVLVIPAPGQPARLPFWRGDDVGRSAELGAALGALTGELARLNRDEFGKRCAALSFDDYATDNLWGLLDDQRAATRVVPTDTTLLVERFRDELGDWRVILHSRTGCGCTDRWRWRWAGGCGSATTSTRSPPPPTTASWFGCPTPGTHHPARNFSFSTPRRSTTSSPPRWASRHCSPPGSGSRRRGLCCCPVATPAAARRCGTSASAPPSCSRWPANIPTSRSCWKPSASACKTSTTARP